MSQPALLASRLGPAWPLLVLLSLCVAGTLPQARAQDAAAREIGWRASGSGGAVTAGRSREVVSAALDVLAEGGNAADAAATSLLGLSVTEHGLFASGGEVPLLIYDAKRKEVKVLSGLGRAPLDPRAIEWFYKNGIPSGGSMKSAPVPGMLHLVTTLWHEVEQVTQSDRQQESDNERGQRSRRQPLARQ